MLGGELPGLVNVMLFSIISEVTNGKRNSWLIRFSLIYPFGEPFFDLTCCPTTVLVNIALLHNNTSQYPTPNNMRFAFLFRICFNIICKIYVFINIFILCVCYTYSNSGCHSSKYILRMSVEAQYISLLLIGKQEAYYITMWKYMYT